MIELGNKVNVGERVDAYVERHRNAGHVEDHAESIVESYIRMVNASEWAGSGDQDRVVAGAVKARKRDIRTFIRKAQEEAVMKAKLA